MTSIIVVIATTIGKRIRYAIMVLISFHSIAQPALVHAQEIDRLKAGVVKIVTHVEEKRHVGTGFIVRLEKNAAYILTASHVIEGDPEPPAITFQTAPTQSFTAKVVGMEGGDPKGLAALVVEGDLPDGLMALAIDETEAKAGDPVTVIGFPLMLGTPWTVVEGQVSGFKGRSLTFQAPIEEGNSGGPLLKDGKVIGVITEKRKEFGSAVNALIAEVTLKGWGVEAKADFEMPVSISGALSNSGWIVYFDFSDRPTEIFYKVGNAGAFKSTGMTDNRGKETGLPMPRASIVLPEGQLASKTTIYVKYKDQRGRDRGPFELTFDPTGERLTDAKELLNERLDEWVLFSYGSGRLKVYFTQLLSYRDVLKAIRYSIDSETLSERFPLAEWTEIGETPTIDSDTQILIEVPIATEYIAVKVQYIDGTESEVKRFRKPQGMASEEGVDKLKLLLAKDPAAAKSKDSNGKTLLHEAAYEGQVGAVKLLLAAGAAVDSRDGDRRTPLHYAADFYANDGQAAAAAVLLANGADVNARDESGNTPLHLVVRSGTKAFVELLIAHNGNVSAVNNSKETPLHRAKTKENMEVLLAHHATVDARDDDKETPLFHAVSLDSRDLADVLIANGADVNAKNDDEETSLHVAAEGGGNDMVRFLLQKGANPNAVNGRMETPLHDAATRENMEVLLAHHATVDARDKDNETPLFNAVRLDRKDLADLLIRNGAGINARKNNDDTPLHVAAERGNNDMVRYLLQKGAIPNAVNKDGETPLYLAADAAHADIIPTLLAAKARIDTPSHDRQWSPLHVAVADGHLDVVEALLAGKADLDAKDSNGETPLDIAVYKKLDDIVRVLNEHRAHLVR